MMEGFALCEIVLNKEGVARDFRYIHVNAAFERIIGLKREEVAGKTGRELFPGIEPWLETYAKVALEGITTRFEAWFDPGKKLLEVSAYSPCKGRFIAVFLDVTERKRMEEALRENLDLLSESQANLRAQSGALEAAANAIVISDRKGVIQWVNPAFTTLTGYSATEIVGKTTSVLKSGKHDAEFYQNLWKTVCGGKVWRGEIVNRRKDGTLYTEEMTITPVIDSGGEVTRFIAIKQDITERKQADESLKLFRELIDRSSDGIEVIDPETGRFLDINRTDCERLGYSREEMLSMSVLDIDTNMVAMSSWQENLSETRLSGFRNIESRHRRKDGSTFPVEVNVRYFELNSSYMVAVVRDITERKRAEGVLEERARHTALEAEVGIALTQGGTLAEMLRLCSGAVVRHLGAAFARIWTVNEPEKMLELQASAGMYTHLNGPHRRVPIDNKSKVGLIAEERNPHLTNQVVGDPRVGEQDWAKREGMVAFAGYPLLVEDRLVGVVAMFARHNLTEATLKALAQIADNIAVGIERKLGIERIAEQAALLDKARDAITVRAIEGGILFWNKAAESMYGWTREEAMGSHLIQLNSLDEAKEAEAYDAVLKDDEWSGELQKKAKDGRLLTVDTRWTLLRDNENQAKSILIISTDITEKKQLEAQFLRAQRMESIGPLAGGIAHDLNNALAPILMAVAVLKDKMIDDADRRVLAVVEASAQHGANLVSQVLSFARGVKGEALEVNLTHLLDGIGNMIRDTFPKNIDFSFAPCRDAWMITGDPTHLNQVFTNLCVNARDAIPNGGSMKVTLENTILDDVYADMNPDSKAGAYLVVKVEDNGSGIPPAIQDRIFEPFFTTKEIGKGTGLGLSTTMAIVKSHGGFINLYSELGKGTTFKVYLPANVSAKAVKKLVIENSALARGNGETVLLVDDEERIRTVAHDLLERFGYRVLLASNGAEALGLYAQHREQISVVLTDMAMPIMDGPSTIIALKAMNPKVNIIGSSGLASNGGVAKAVGAGVKHFVPKPYTAETLLKVLAEALREDA
jgi:PAS domain S-box-containing protein